MSDDHLSDEDLEAISPGYDPWEHADESLLGETADLEDTEEALELAMETWEHGPFGIALKIGGVWYDGRCRQATGVTDYEDDVLGSDPLKGELRWSPSKEAREALTERFGDENGNLGIVSFRFDGQRWDDRVEWRIEVFPVDDPDRDLPPVEALKLIESPELDRLNEDEER